ncbi:deoxyribodipyrimidine photo-lyase [Fibrella forsythiae]|uniref:deoxyribodipyrimidine photo-lyase n=1 Tax=Fibrella forsythiae TaxID=2817061 RepID=UPI00286DC3F1|nr:deoxyribodipyrimidine photo-lyase [Fibrella forsythiae]
MANQRVIPAMSTRPPVYVLWFKRDLRLRDHVPLQEAVRSGKPVLLLYCFEPSVMADPNYDQRHWRFVTECLADLNRQLPKLMSEPAGRQAGTYPRMAAVRVRCRTGSR